MIFVGIALFALIYLTTVGGFLYLLNEQGKRASDQEARGMAERNALLERIQRPHQQPTPPNVMPLHPVEASESAGPIGEPPTDELYLAGTINFPTSTVSEDEPA